MSTQPQLLKTPKKRGRPPDSRNAPKTPATPSTSSQRNRSVPLTPDKVEDFKAAMKLLAEKEGNSTAKYILEHIEEGASVKTILQNMKNPHGHLRSESRPPRTRPEPKQRPLSAVLTSLPEDNQSSSSQASTSDGLTVRDLVGTNTKTFKSRKLVKQHEAGTDANSQTINSAAAAPAAPEDEIPPIPTHPAQNDLDDTSKPQSSTLSKPVTPVVVVKSPVKPRRPPGAAGPYPPRHFRKKMLLQTLPVIEMPSILSNLLNLNPWSGNTEENAEDEPDSQSEDQGSSNNSSGISLDIDVVTAEESSVDDHGEPESTHNPKEIRKVAPETSSSLETVSSESVETVVSQENTMKSNEEGERPYLQKPEKPVTPTPPPPTTETRFKLLDSQRTPVSTAQLNAWRYIIDQFRPGSRAFMKYFVRGEHLYFKNPKINVKTHQDGTKYAEDIGDFSTIHLFKKKKGLGLVVPKLTFWNLHEYLDFSRDVTAIDSLTQTNHTVNMDALIGAFENEDDRECLWNVLSMEVTQSQQELDGKIAVPKFVSDHCMIKKIEDAIIKEIEKEKMKKGGRYRKQVVVLERQLQNLPRYQKFLLLSMAGSFTGIHVDFSGSSVFYHVIVGKKIFYVAPPTEENLRMYKKHELDPELPEWIGVEMFDEWQRIEINPGETAFIPAGWIHWVYTPLESIVFGGNYLLEQSLARQFEMTRLEEACNEKGHIPRSHMFEGFRIAMYQYISYCLIPNLREALEKNEPADDLIAMATLFQEELESDKNSHFTDAFKSEGKLKILNELAETLNPGARVLPTKTEKNREIRKRRLAVLDKAPERLNPRPKREKKVESESESEYDSDE